MKKYLICTLICLSTFSSKAEKRIGPFPIPEGMELRVQFWVNVFTQYSIDQTVLFDADKPERIYRVVDFREMNLKRKVSRFEREQIIKKERGEIIAILKQLSKRNYHEYELNGETLRIYRLFGRKPNRKTFLKAVKRVRMQGGMREAFKEGIERSGRYLNKMRKIFREKKLPEDLIYLVHVESSFNYRAWSKSGAVGVWQFTRSTGRQFMRINHTVDERKDPYISTVAAAQLLKKNYLALGNWPLAVTAYNHGLTGMKQSVRKVGCKDLNLIVQHYRSRSFGFASKNFYTEFLAAVLVARNPVKYFGKIHYDPPEKFQVIKTPFALRLDEAAQAFRVKSDYLRELNPALNRKIFKGMQSIPKGTLLRLPQKASVLGAVDRIRDQFEEKQMAGLDRSEIESEEGYLVTETSESENYADVYANKDSHDSIFQLVKLSRQILQGDHTQVQELQNLSEASTSVIEKEQFLWQKIPFLLRMDYIHVFSGNRIQVLPEETLGHYADWLEIPTWQLRKLNGLRYHQPIRIGQELRMVFGRVDTETYEQRRLAYHQELQRKFFEKHRIESSKVHTIRRGETLWTMVKRHGDIPLWLLMQYNSGKDLHLLRPGDKLIVPIIRQVG
jgi:membrane-bound lytic murein transglycosylase D